MNEDSWGPRLTKEDVDAYYQRHGAKPTKLIMAVLGRNQAFYAAIQTDVGQELLKDLLPRMDVLLEKLADGSLTEEERIEYKVRKDIFERWAGKISNYYRHATKLKQGG